MKLKGFLLNYFLPNSGLRKFGHDMSTVAECHKKATVVLRCLQYLATVKVSKCCKQSTDYRHLLITLSVQLCIQRDGRFDW